MEFIATCAGAFEHMLAEELSGFGIGSVRPLTGQVSFTGELADGLRACLMSRLASRVVLVLARIDAHDSDALYEGISQIAWEDELVAGQPFSVDAHGTNAELRTTRFVAQRASDAIRDRIFARTGVRAHGKAGDGLPISVRISKDRASIGIVLSGHDPLFQRGYRSWAQRHAHLRSDYAAAMVAAAGDARSYALPWDEDGILADEVGSIGSGKPPALGRGSWGFAAWKGFDEGLWERLTEEAGGSSAKEPPRIVPVDEAEVLLCDLSRIDVLDVTGMASARAELSRLCSEAREGARCAVLARAGFLRGGEAQGGIACRIGRDEAVLAVLGASELVLGDTVEVAGHAIPVQVAASDQFAARLAKMAKQRAKQARREEVSCYRIYDADLPDYAVSVELFQSSSGARHVSISEYAAPKEIDAALAQARLADAIAIAGAVLEVPAESISLRVRSKDRGGSQYAELGHADERGGSFVVDEGGLDFGLDFSRRLDCGIFLDHRDTRAMLREMMKEAAEPKRFLNLFCYTGTASCYAADGGAASTTSVDLSAPSLAWARRNMERNGFTGPDHRFVQADVLEWVRETRHSQSRFELVFCDVPTFSNSSRMRSRSFDVQRDHAELLIGVSRLLSPGGVCVFSCNLRSFKPDEAALAKAGVSIEDITAETIPFDFERSPRIHSCYLVRRA